MAITLKTPEEVAKIRESCRLQSLILNEIRDRVRPGVSTGELNEFAETRCREENVLPAFKGYHGFPAAICASRNERVVHGIPSREEILEEGDILSVDFGVTKDGWISDACQTFAIGEISEEARLLLERTKESLYRGIDQATPGNHIGDIGHAIQTFVESHGYSVVRETVGHGIGRRMHEDPEVPNWGRPGRGPKIVAGMTICIEPIVCAGTHRIKTSRDGWTTTTADGKLSAHFEHQILITPKGPEILTPWDEKN